MNRFTKIARLHKVIFKQAAVGQQIGTPNGMPAAPPRGPGVGGAASGRSTGASAANTNPFQGFAPRDPQAPPQYNIHNPSPEQGQINAAFAKQQAGAGFNSKVNDTLSGASGPYNNAPGMSDKQREMANYKDFRQGYQQEKSAPTTKGVKGEAIKQDKENDTRALVNTGIGLATGVGGKALSSAASWSTAPAVRWAGHGAGTAASTVAKPAVDAAIRSPVR